MPIAVLVITLLGAGCISHRLDGPIHAADGPPWIAEGAVKPVAALDATTHRVLLIGDGGLFLEDDPTLAAVGSWTQDVPSTVLFLGDNIYNEGLVDDDRERGERILTQQLEATSSHKIFIPGNHDWGFAPTDMNATAIRNQQSFVDGWPGGSAEFLPKDGCMGPVSKRLAAGDSGARGITIVALDPTPWINPALRDACPTPESFEGHLAALGEILAANADDWVIVVSHYPMITGGPHGGLSYGFLVDTIVSVLGWMWGGLMNTYEPGYADWIEQTEAVFRKNPPAVYAAGHDHNLQVLDAKGAAGIYIVSGAGAPDRVSTVTHLRETVFAHAHPGFVVVDLGTRGGQPVAVLRVIENGKAEPVFEIEIEREQR